MSEQDRARFAGVGGYQKLAALIRDAIEGEAADVDPAPALGAIRARTGNPVPVAEVDARDLALGVAVIAFAAEYFRDATFGDLAGRLERSLRTADRRAGRLAGEVTVEGGDAIRRLRKWQDRT
jgi:hypothetical protein